MNNMLQEWIDALRSGEYKQGKGHLKDEDRFCCLGVLCDLYAKKEPSEYQWHNGIFFEGNPREIYRDDLVDEDMGQIWKTTLPQSIEHKLNLDFEVNIGTVDRQKFQDALAEMNDGGDDFKYIAAYIENTLTQKGLLT